MATADKYDRQLRLWGANGQRKLMTSHILLINATAVGTETLKNLVLPGLGSFTILDNSGIESNDLGNNFFTTSGPYRGQSAVENLCEMNPDVKGTFLNSDLSTELEQGHQSPPQTFLISYSIDSQFLQRFSLVILANPVPSLSQLVASSCWDHAVPLIVVRSYGFIGTYRFQIRGLHGIVESKPEAELLDLRINCPFKELEVRASSL
jgi:NEDD8-activating enzyme E1 regulatory subunit